MSASGKAFDEVKQILGRLDRSIDEARHKRLGPTEPDRPAAPEGSPTDRPIGTAPKPGQAPATLPTTPQRRVTKYGRAKPLRRADEAPAQDSTSAWVDRPRPNPAPDDNDPMIG
ncbi:MAG: hypothetical protein DHS20C14_16060 [Phycisphaeraceae bacterium]|nr:MAG: hypothetical protein DHS20C14_16060 [Phycisphaeraceae bacterium]